MSSPCFGLPRLASAARLALLAGLSTSLAIAGSLGCSSQNRAPATDSPSKAAPSSAASPTPTPPPTGATPAGAERVEGEGYVVKVERPPSVRAGQPAEVAVVLEPATGYKINLEFPFALEVTPPDGVTLAKPKQTQADASRFEEAGARFVVPFEVPGEARELAFRAKFKFAVCTPERCDPASKQLAWSLPVVSP